MAEPEFESRLSDSRVCVFNYYPVLPSDKLGKYVVYKAQFYGVINYTDIQIAGGPSVLIHETEKLKVIFLLNFLEIK